MTSSSHARKWEFRTVPEDLAKLYTAEGWWDESTLGGMVEDGLGRLGHVGFQVRSQVRPYKGTFAEVDRAARSLAARLQEQGVGAGDVVVFQMPNWVEAGIAFWAGAYLGAIVVPIVHFYGPKEVSYILDVTQPEVVVTPEQFGHTNHLEMYSELLRDSETRWLVAGDTPTASLPAGATRLADLLDGDPIAATAKVDPAEPTLIAFTSGTTRDPKGVIHSHRSIACETRHLDYMMPPVGAQVTGAPVGHFIGMLNAFLIPLLRESPVNLIDVWNPAEVLKMMLEDGLTMGGGATFFLTSLIDHPDFTDEHLKLMPYIGLGGSTIPSAVTERATRMGMTVYRSYGSTEHPSITACTIADPEVKRLNTDGRTMPGVEIRLDDEGEIISRGPDACMGYTDPELTKKAFDDDGWYRTGDVGVLDADGYLSITDRVSDIIIRGGENLSAQEIEDLMMGVAGVAEVSVVSAPDDRLGEHAAAIVRLREGADAPTLDDVRKHMAETGIAKQKWPESLYVVADFPRTASGKVQKFRLRQQLREGQL